MRLWHAVLAVFMVVIPFAACLADEAATQPNRPAPQFDPVIGTILASVDNSVAWARYDVKAVAGRSPIAPSYTIRYYVQRIGKEPILAYQGSGRITVDDRATILEDGTILLWRRDGDEGFLLWMHGGVLRRQSVSKISPGAGLFLMLFANGVVTVTGGGSADPAGTIWWVPIRKEDIDVEHRIKMGTGTPRKFVRSGDQIAWISSTDSPAGREPAGAGLLNVIDIARGQTRAIRIQGPIRRVQELDAFDGLYGIDNWRLIDTTNGKNGDIPALDQRMGVHRIIPLALVDKRAYFVFDRLDNFEVMAVPVDDLTHGKIVYQIAKSALAKESFQEHLSAKNLFFASEKTIYAWNGTTWEDILAKK